MSTRTVLDDALAGTFPASDPPAMTSPVIATSLADVDDTAGASLTTLRLFRVVDDARADDAFAGADGGGRWTSPGRAVVYAALSPTGALLEFLAHLEGVTPRDVSLVEAHVRNAAMSRFDPPPAHWRELPYRDDVRAHGDAWFDRGEALLLKVPSALVPGAWNVLVNAAHADFERLQPAARITLHVDGRLRT